MPTLDNPDQEEINYTSKENIHNTQSRATDILFFTHVFNAHFTFILIMCLQDFFQKLNKIYLNVFKL